MSSQKGSNGILDGQRNVEVFLGWVAETADFKHFIYQGLLSISRVASECGLNRDVFYTNPDIRDIHLPAPTRTSRNQFSSCYNSSNSSKEVVSWYPLKGTVIRDLGIDAATGLMSMSDKGLPPQS